MLIIYLIYFALALAISLIGFLYRERIAQRTWWFGIFVIVNIPLFLGVVSLIVPLVPPDSQAFYFGTGTVEEIQSSFLFGGIVPMLASWIALPILCKKD